MKIDVLSSSTVKITLSGVDMRDYDVQYENLSRTNPDTKRLLGEVLKAVSLESDIFFDANADRLFIEAFPRSDGGCMLYISSLDEEEKKTKPKKSKPEARESDLLICGTEGIGNLGDLCRTLCALKEREGASFESAAYYNGSRYFLSIRSRWNKSRLEAVLREYGDIISDSVSEAVLKEYCTEIAAAEGAEIIADCIG